MAKASFPSSPALNKLTAIGARLPLAQAQAQGKAFDAATTVQNEKERRAAGAAAARAAAAAKVESLKALMNPGAYTYIQKDDLGVDILDPEGNKVDINTVANNTGVNRATILETYAKSQNPEDLDYIQNSKALNEYLLAKTQVAAAQASGDKDLKTAQEAKGKIDDYEGMAPELKDYPKADDVAKRFQVYWGKYYGIQNKPPIQQYGLRIPYLNPNGIAGSYGSSLSSLRQE